MPPPITILPLGTSSAVPSFTRNHSSLAIILPSSSTLLIDVGEGTQHRIQRFPIKLNKIEKIFITHLHGDHIFGLCPLLTTLMNGAGGSDNDIRLLNTNDSRAVAPQNARVELYGPKGLREYIRSGLTLTYTNLDNWYVVHELHFPHDPPSNPSKNLYQKELPSGTNIPQDIDGFWRNITSWTHPTRGTTEFTISAAEIKHTVPSLGYVLAESQLPGKIPPDYAKRINTHKRALLKSSGYKNPIEFLRVLQSPDCAADVTLELPDGTRLTRPPAKRGRKITVLGDTCDPSPIIPLAEYSDVLVHEATNAYLPGVDPMTKESENYAAVEERSRSRGHSTPEMAGRFASAIKLGVKEVGGRDGLLILNHFSSRYKDDEADGLGGAAMKIMERIGECAKSAWVEDSGGGEGVRVVCARDGVPVDVKA